MLSQEQLKSLLHLLLESISVFDKQYPRVVFFDDWSLYRHMRRFRLPQRHFRANIGTLLDILEPYIPFKLTEENFEMFMDAVIFPDNADPQLTHKPKLDFVIALRAIRQPHQWEQALEVCEAIRALKEELVTTQA